MWKQGLRTAVALSLVGLGWACSSVAPLDVTTLGPDAGVDIPVSSADLAGAPPSPADLAYAVGDMASPPAPAPGRDATVTLFDRTLFAFGPDDKRQARAQVTLPGGLYRSITLHVTLECPAGGCDPFDRVASLGIVDGSGAGRVLEIGRLITPFGRGGAWDIDVTALAPLLTGDRTVNGFIDTWVGNGTGWLMSARLVYVGGTPTREPMAVLPLDWGDVVIGDPTPPNDSSLAPQQVKLPPDARSAEVWLTTTGHGQGNALNCAEFCPLNHILSKDGLTIGSHLLWRSDCGSNPIQPQGGTWTFARAGWCPGADVIPWRVDIPVGGKRSFVLSYSIGKYVNTCSPAPNSCQVDTCTLGRDCQYDGNGHTPPNYKISAFVIAYR